MDETSKQRRKKYLAIQCQNLLKEYQDLLIEIRDEVIQIYSKKIPLTSVEAVAMEFANQEGAKDAIMLFIKRIHDKANE